MLLVLLVFSDGTAPKVIEALKDTAAVVSKDVTLKCKIDAGKPKATTEWYKCINSYFCSLFLLHIFMKFICRFRTLPTCFLKNVQHLQYGCTSVHCAWKNARQIKLRFFLNIYSD